MKFKRGDSVTFNGRFGIVKSDTQPNGMTDVKFDDVPHGERHDADSLDPVRRNGRKPRPARRTRARRNGEEEDADARQRGRLYSPEEELRRRQEREAKTAPPLPRRGTKARLERLAEATPRLGPEETGRAPFIPLVGVSRTAVDDDAGIMAMRWRIAGRAGAKKDVFDIPKAEAKLELRMLSPDERDSLVAEYQERVTADFAAAKSIKRDVSEDLLEAALMTETRDGRPVKGTQGAHGISRRAAIETFLPDEDDEYESFDKPVKAEITRLQEKEDISEEEAIARVVARGAKKKTSAERREEAFIKARGPLPKVDRQQVAKEYATTQKKTATQVARMGRKRAYDKSSLDAVLGSAGAAFFARSDRPRVDTDGDYHGNPIDGTAYFLVVSNASGAVRHWITTSEFNVWRDRQAAQANIHASSKVDVASPKYFLASLGESKDIQSQPSVQARGKGVRVGSAKVKELQVEPSNALVHDGKVYFWYDKKSKAKRKLDRMTPFTERSFRADREDSIINLLAAELECSQNLAKQLVISGCVYMAERLHQAAPPLVPYEQEGTRYTFPTMAMGQRIVVRFTGKQNNPFFTWLVTHDPVVSRPDVPTFTAVDREKENALRGIKSLIGRMQAGLLRLRTMFDTDRWQLTEGRDGMEVKARPAIIAQRTTRSVIDLAKNIAVLRQRLAIALAGEEEVNGISLLQSAAKGIGKPAIGDLLIAHMPQAAEELDLIKQSERIDPATGEGYWQTADMRTPADYAQLHESLAEILLDTRPIYKEAWTAFQTNLSIDRQFILSSSGILRALDEAKVPLPAVPHDKLKALGLPEVPDNLADALIALTGWLALAHRHMDGMGVNDAETLAEMKEKIKKVLGIRDAIFDVARKEWRRLPDEKQRQQAWVVLTLPVLGAADEEAVDAGRRLMVLAALYEHLGGYQLTGPYVNDRGEADWSAMGALPKLLDRVQTEITGSSFKPKRSKREEVMYDPIVWQGRAGFREDETDVRIEGQALPDFTAGPDQETILGVLRGAGLGDTGGYTVYYTYNPMLFEFTRTFWPGRGDVSEQGQTRAGETRLGSAPNIYGLENLFHAIDQAGSYGSVVAMAQRAMLTSADERSMKITLGGGARTMMILDKWKPHFERHPAGGAAPIRRSGDGSFDLLNVLWLVGMPVYQAAYLGVKEGTDRGVAENKHPSYMEVVRSPISAIQTMKKTYGKYARNMTLAMEGQGIRRPDGTYKTSTFALSPIREVEFKDEVGEDHLYPDQSTFRKSTPLPRLASILGAIEHEIERVTARLRKQ